MHSSDFYFHLPKVNRTQLWLNEENLQTCIDYAFCNSQLQPVFTFANQAGLDMLETTLVALQDITLDKIFDEAGLKQFHSGLVKLMEQVLVTLLNNCA